MDYRNKPSPQEYLSHHGILGQKWGKKNGPPYPLGESDHSASEKKAGWKKSLGKGTGDGSSPSTGSKRYSTDVAGAKQKLAKAKAEEKKAATDYNKATLYGQVYNEAATKKLRKAGINTQLAKTDLQDEKAKEKMNSETKKSQHRVNLENAYLKKGFTQEEAEVQAYKRERTEKILAVTAGLTVAAIAGYAAYKYHDKVTDKLIQPGTLLQNISRNDTAGVRDAFYSSMTKMDNTKYRGMYGQSILAEGHKVYEKQLSVNSALKVASESHAREALADLVRNDASYAKTLETHLQNSIGRYGSDAQNGVIKRGLDSLKKGKVDARVYEALNMTLVDHNLGTSDAVHKGFYNKLKSLGYDAIIDVNDKKYSGYKTSSPLITFNATKTAVQNVREVGQAEVQKAASKGYLDIYVKSLIPQAAGAAGAGALVTAGMKAVESRSDAEIVRQYRAEHPNTKLSYTDILRNEKQ